MAVGIDMPTECGRVIADIRNARLDFVARYYRNPSSEWPALSASEARLLTSEGLSIVAIWESASDHVSYFSRSSGVADAASAFRQASAIGQPANSAIYFAVDYDATTADIDGPISDYFLGIAAGFAASTSAPCQVGVYGSGAVCHALTSAGLARFSWLAMSSGWAGSRSFSAWSIKQGAALSTLPFDHDSDQAIGDYGEFQIAIA